MNRRNLRNRRWVLGKRPIGMVSKENFQFEESEIEEIKDGECL